MSSDGAMIDPGLLTDPVYAEIMWKLDPASTAVRLSNGRWRPTPHLRLLARKLVDVSAGRCPRLLVAMPPRHGKSELVSHYYPIWHMDVFPGNRVILVSYEFEFASKWSGKCRDTILANQDLLTTRFMTKNPAAHYWETVEGGAMMAAGVGGPITGKGADILIIDDPIKNAEEASSWTMRQKIWEWWTSTARTRLEPGGAVVVMMTRWHEDDLIGRLEASSVSADKALLLDTPHERWEKFDFPMIADEEYFAQNNIPLDGKDLLGRKLGDALWPERYDEKDAALIRSAVGERVWVSLYQERPADTAEDGNVYYAYKSAVNDVVFDYDPHMLLGWSLDFNVDPMCSVIFQYERSTYGGASRMCVIDEIVAPNSNTYEVCGLFMQRVDKMCGNIPVVVEIFGDASGTQRSANSKKTSWEIVRECLSMGRNIRPIFKRKRANPSVVDRLNAVNTMLKNAAGDSRLFIHPRCAELRADFRKVRFLVDANGLSRDQLDKSNKTRTHASDALGYAVEYLFGLQPKAGTRRGIMQ